MSGAGFTVSVDLLHSLADTFRDKAQQVLTEHDASVAWLEDIHEIFGTAPEARETAAEFAAFTENANRAVVQYCMYLTALGNALQETGHNYTNVDQRQKESLDQIQEALDAAPPSS